MSVLINSSTKVICQGITGAQGTFHSEQAIAYGTQMVGGVTPGKGGETHLGLPVFDTVKAAREATGCDASVIYVPAAVRGRRDPGGGRRRGAADRLHHRGHPGDGHDQGQARAAGGSQLAPDRPELPGRHHAGRSARSASCRATSTSRARSASCRARARSPTRRSRRPPRPGLGQTTCVGIGGDPVKGTDFIDVLEMFIADPQTEGDHHDRRDRRQRPRRTRPSSWKSQRLHEADRRLHRRAHRTAGPPHGPRRRDHLRRQGWRRGEDSRRCGVRASASRTVRPGSAEAMLEAMGG